jgi:hypothetical protein
MIGVQWVEPRNSARLTWAKKSADSRARMTTMPMMIAIEVRPQPASPAR